MGGRGCGKSNGAAAWALTRPPRSLGMLAAPTTKHLNAVLEPLLEIAYQAKLVKKDGYNKNRGELRLIDGKFILLRSLDTPETVLGPNLNWFVLDEARVLKTVKAWNILIGCVRAPGPRQRLVLSNVPREAHRHWLVDLFVTRGIKGAEIIRGRTKDNPHLPPDFDSDLRAQYTDAFAALELDGELIDLGAVEVYDVSKLLSGALPPGEKIIRTVRGWDAASGAEEGDYTVGVLMSIDAENKLYIRDVVRGRWAPHERDQVMLRTAQRDGPGVTIWVPKERTGAGRSQVDYWKRKLVGFRVVSALEGGQGGNLTQVEKKKVRAGPLAGQIGHGNVCLTAEAGYWENYNHEGSALYGEGARAQFRQNLDAFPHGRTKDESDAAAGALQALTQRDTGITVGKFAG